MVRPTAQELAAGNEKYETKIMIIASEINILYNRNKPQIDYEKFK